MSSLSMMVWSLEFVSVSSRLSSLRESSTGSSTFGIGPGVGSAPDDPESRTTELEGDSANSEASSGDLSGSTARAIVAVAYPSKSWKRALIKNRSFASYRFFSSSRSLINKSSFEGVDRNDQRLSGHQIVSKNKFAESSAKLRLILKIIKIPQIGKSKLYYNLRIYI